MKMLIYILTVIGLANCRTNSLNKISLTYIFPLKHSQTVVENYVTVIYIATQKDCVLYELPVKETTEEDGRLISDTITYEYFVFKKSERFGYLIKSLSDSFKTKIDVDSILSERALYHINIDSSMLPFLKDFRMSSKTSTSQYLQKKFGYMDTRIDSAYFYFNKNLNGAAYTISKKMDSLFNSKCYKIDILLKKDTSSNAEYLNKYRTISLEFKKLKINNEKELTIFFQRFDRW